MLSTISKKRSQLAMIQARDNAGDANAFGSYRLNLEKERFNIRDEADPATSVYTSIAVHPQYDLESMTSDERRRANYLQNFREYQKGLEYLQSVYGYELPVVEEFEYSWSWSFEEVRVFNTQKIGLIAKNKYQMTTNQNTDLTLIALERGPLLQYIELSNGQKTNVSGREAITGFVMLRPPETNKAELVMRDLIRRLERLELISSNNEELSLDQKRRALIELASMMYGYYNTSPFIRGSASIGNVFLTRFIDITYLNLKTPIYLLHLMVLILRPWL